MDWENPEILFFIFALPLLALFFYYALWRKKRMLERFAEWSLMLRLMRGASLGRQLLKLGLLLPALALIIVALARPQWGAVERELTHKGLDILVALDVSNSMLATDVRPNRLKRATEQLGNLIGRLKGDRVGILTFAGDAFLACPLTVDYPLALRILQTVDVDSISRQGTMIGEAIRAAQRAFERSGGDGDRLLVLLTDGEDQGSQPEQAAREAAEKNMLIYAIGIGAELAVPIEMPGGDYKRDEQGKIVSSKLDFQTLQQVALATGGKAIKSTPSGFLEIDQIIADVREMRRAQLQSKTYALLEERFQWALAPALLLLFAEMLLSDRRAVALEWKGRFQ